jgi:hypothetical protein
LSDLCSHTPIVARQETGKQGTVKGHRPLHSN